MARTQFKVTFTNAQPGAPVSVLTPSVEHIYSTVTAVQPVGGKQLYLDATNAITVWSDAQDVIAQTVDGAGLFIQGTATVASPTVIVGDGTAPTNPAGSTASGAGLPANILTKTTTYTATAGDFVQGDTTSAGFSITLPASPAVGALVAAKKISADVNTLTIVPSGGGTIDGDPNATTTTQWAGAVFEHVGSNAWRIAAAMQVTGPAGPTGPIGLTGPTGPTGPGVPNGGLTGQVLKKNSNTNQDTVWGTAGGGGFQQTWLKTGRWTPGPFQTGTPLSVAVNNAYATPIYITASVTLTGIGVNVTTAGATTNVRLGIYGDDGTGYPGALTLDAGTVDASTTGAKSIVISQTLAPGLYWLVAAVQGSNSVTMSSNNGGGNAASIALSADDVGTAATNSITGYTATAVSGALPGTWTLTVANRAQSVRVVVGV